MKKITTLLLLILAITVISCTPINTDYGTTGNNSTDDNQLTGEVVSDELSEKCANCPDVDTCAKAKTGGCTGEGQDSETFGIQEEHVGCGNHN